ncbi:MAG: hypothetical protein ACYSR5_03830, partial [Planctomycetota bacterium]
MANKTVLGPRLNESAAGLARALGYDEKDLVILHHSGKCRWFEVDMAVTVGVNPVVRAGNIIGKEQLTVGSCGVDGDYTVCDTCVVLETGDGNIQICVDDLSVILNRQRTFALDLTIGI